MKPLDIFFLCLVLFKQASVVLPALIRSHHLFLQAPSFYWEIEIVSYGDSEEDSGPIVSFGFATEAEKRDGAWTNPVGTCLFHK